MFGKTVLALTHWEERLASNLKFDKTIDNASIPSNYMDQFASLLAGNMTGAFSYVGSVNISGSNDTLREWWWVNGTRIMKYWEFTSR